jgi:beta-galactosidase
MFNQGFVIYETTVKNRKSSFVGRIHDYALVFLDGVLINTLDRSESTYHNFVVDCQKSSCLLTIAVEAMGHVNFDTLM